MKERNEFIAPISIDFGARHSGVFRSCYAKSTRIQDFAKQPNVHVAGEVLHLVEGKYTLLMRERTQARHMRRCNDRRKMAKRLLMVILEKRYGFPARKHQQVLGFFLNRRGFTRLEETFSMEALAYFPENAWDKLPVGLQQYFGSPQELAEAFSRQISDDVSVFPDFEGSVSQHLLSYRQAKQAVDYAKEASGAIKQRLQGGRIAEPPRKRIKLSQLPNGVLKSWRQVVPGIFDGLSASHGRADLLAWLNQEDEHELQGLLQKMDDILGQFQMQAEDILAKVHFDKFDIEKHAEVLADPVHRDHVRRHLEHLFFAIHKIAEEVRSGARHRRKYFEEIHYDLEHADSHPHHYMQRFAEALRQHGELDNEKLWKLICHISNLELKPLRAYFNDKAHRQGDQWQPKRLAAIVSRWFMRQWRVNAGKDGLDKVESYQLLREQWQKHPDKDDIIGFWLHTDPEWTIPPYQSHTNRRPPDCQSLILNPNYLCHHYPNWRQWLEQMLKVEGVLVPGLEAPKSSKGRSLLSDDEAKLRELQALLDRRKDADPLCLNTIWGYYHQAQKYPTNNEKYHTANSKMNEAIARSALPDELKQNLQWGKQGSFGHFLNKYYQTRRRARDGRYFVHPVRGKRRRWHDDGCLLTICWHRPRQKKHQLLPDVAALLGLHPGELQVCLKDRKLVDLFESIPGFKKTTANAARAQKDYRGELRLLLQKRKERELITLVEQVKVKSTELAERLAPDDDILRTRIQTRANDVFVFAQMYNLVFQDRSGFSSTCPVCSADNARRMQQGEHGHAFASRLPALSMRVIDGAVRKLVEHKAREISKRHWRMIAPKLKAGNKVCVPLVLEQNRFEFEPDLAKIKGKQTRNIPNKGEDQFSQKMERIQNQANGLCAYTGRPVGNDGEFDHIIPRASKYGTLNDEANLIYVSAEGNKTKGNSFYGLSDLSSAYKQQQFGASDDAKIKKQIYRELVGTEPNMPLPERFCFGQYLNFLNLTDDQAKAMRHALFLDEEDPLRQMVIRALENRNRTFVNGTQRYFAQMIADNLFEMARREGFEGCISFDYFEYPADPNHPKGTQLLRRDLQDHGVVPEKGNIQEAYSHFIDAQMAFLLAAEDHKNDGSMGLIFAEGETVWPINHQTGEIGSAHVYGVIRLQAERVEDVELSRKKSPDGVRIHRQFHRDNFYADRYFPLLIGRKGESVECRYGFSWKNSASLGKHIPRDLREAVARFAADRQWRDLAKKADSAASFANMALEYSGKRWLCIAWDRRAIHKWSTSQYSCKEIARGRKYGEEIKLIRKLSYQTQKQAIEDPQVIAKVLNDSKYWAKNGIVLPCKEDWERLRRAWEENKREDKDFQSFIRKYFLDASQGVRHEAQSGDMRHRKVRKVFSLPVLNENAHYLHQRRSITGRLVWQLIADADSRKDGNKFKRLVMSIDGELVEVMNAAFDSSHTFKVQLDEVYSGKFFPIDPNRWYDHLGENPPGVSSLAFKVDNRTRPRVKVTVHDPEAFSLDHDLLKPKDQSAREKVTEQLKQGVTTLSYTLAGYSAPVKKALLAALQ